MEVPATQDDFCFLTDQTHDPSADHAAEMNNHGNFIISLCNSRRGWHSRPKAAGIDVFPGFSAAAPPCMVPMAPVTGVQIGDMGLLKDGSQGPNYTPGVEILRRHHAFWRKAAAVRSASS